MSSNSCHATLSEDASPSLSVPIVHYDILKLFLPFSQEYRTISLREVAAVRIGGRNDRKRAIS